MATKAVRQPKRTVSGATIRGVRTAPTAAPELKMPLPRLRSAGGRIVAVTPRAHGQLNASPTPSSARSSIRTATLGEKAAAIPIRDHQATAPAYAQRTFQRS